MGVSTFCILGTCGLIRRWRKSWRIYLWKWSRKRIKECRSSDVGMRLKSFTSTILFVTQFSCFLREYFLYYLIVFCFETGHQDYRIVQTLQSVHMHWLCGERIGFYLLKWEIQVQDQNKQGPKTIHKVYGFGLQKVFHNKGLGRGLDLIYP